MKYIIIFLLFGLLNSFYIAVTPALTCLFFQRDSETTHFKYQVNAENPQNVNINIISTSGMIIDTFTSHTGDATFDGRTKFKICLQTTGSTNKAVAIDVWTQSQNTLKGVAKKSDYFELHSAILRAGDGLKEISRLERFQEDRQNIHSELILKREESIRGYGIAKMVIIVVLALMQILFLKRLFRQKKVMDI